MIHRSAFFPKPSVLAKIDVRKPAVIEASAGTGKTYTLEHLVVDLLLSSSAQLDELLVVTFTEKAALELRARLRRKLRSLLREPWASGIACPPEPNSVPDPYSSSDSSSGPPSDGLSDGHLGANHESGRPLDALGWVIDHAKRRKLDEALRRFDAASISTIHAFCHRTLTEQSFSHGRLFGERLVDARSVFDEAFLNRLRTTFGCQEPWRSFLRAWLPRASAADLRDILFDCHSKRGQFERVLDLGCLLERVQAVQKLDLAPHALRPAFVRANLAPSTARALVERLNRLRSIVKTVRAPEDVPAFLAAIEEEDGRPGGAFQFIVERIHGKSPPGGLLHRLEDALVELERVRVSLPSAMVQLFLPEVLAEAHTLKQKRGELDFDDMLTLLARRLSEPEGRAFVDRLRARYRFALIDEFQDTDETQWQIFRQVFVESRSTHSLFVIGDPKQAIYGFRGADVETYRAACQRIEEADGRTIQLSKNHRSTPALVDAINQILDQRARQPFFSGAIGYPEPVTPAERGLRSIVRNNKIMPPVHVFHVTSPEGQLTVREARTTLARRMADEIHDLIHEETMLIVAENLEPEAIASRTPRPAVSTHSRRLVARDIFILTRSAKEGIEVATHLRGRGIPHAFYKQDGLFQTREAQDIRAVFRAILEPTSRSRRLCAWQTAFFSVELSALGEYVDVPADAPMFAQLLEWQKLAESNQYSRLFTRLLEDTHLIERELFLGAGERRITNYGHIFEHLLEETFRRKVTLVELIRCLDEYIEGRRHPPGEDGNIQRLETDRDAVQIMTMHKSKGLEASVVFLFGGFDAPAERASIYHRDGRRYLALGTSAQTSVESSETMESIEKERDEEDQRLLYVAMTRSGARLYLPYFAVASTSKAGSPPARDLSQLDGPYRVLNRRLDDVVQPGMDQALFRVEEIMVGASDAGRSEEKREAPSRGGGEGGGEGEGQDDGEEAQAWLEAFAALRPSEPPSTIHPWALPLELRVGRLITSYSRIKAASGGYTAPSAPSEGPMAGSSADFEPPPPATALGHDPSGQEDLPGGPIVGRLLHSLLEEVPLEAVKSSTRAAFGQAPEVRSLVTRVLDRYGQPETYADRALDLVFNALTTPMTLESTTLRQGLAACANHVREMAFLFPLRATSPFAPEFMKGFIDLVVEADGRYFLIDWKSDILATYDEEEVAKHVAHNYVLQADVYALALTKHLGIQDAEAFDACFGGIAYCFIRGMRGGPDEPMLTPTSTRRSASTSTPASTPTAASTPAQGAYTRGVYFTRPTWASLVEAESHLGAMSTETGP
ncbi:MAG: UvrD-helicase domain-containing protein [Deltaproteobacteria bacterium]|nr:UvrD-helicase domain-containing protein [Deltaproteobacteria bacterium]